MSRSWTSSASFGPLFVGALLSGLVAGCVTARDNRNATCLDNPAACPAGQRCYQGFCIPGTSMEDAGPGMDAAIDAGAMDDAGCPRAGEACPYPLPGRCSMGQLACNARGVPLCTRANNPMPETCNGVDDDCDSRTDEQSDIPCTTAGGCMEVGEDIVCRGVCSAGVLRCEMGVLSTMCMGETGPRSPTDGCTPADTIAVDDDCDGEIDEDCTCTDDATIACYTASQQSAGIGACALGTSTCVDGTFGPCMGAVRPSDETCANPDADDDCDGVLDDVPGVGEPCETGLMGTCNEGITACDGTMTVSCRGTDPRMAELCDLADDDCDGMTDEGFDLLTDVANCGECGHACGEGQSCCGGMCVSTQADDANCGVCGMTCEGGRECCQGMCREPSEPECTGCLENCSTSGRSCCQDEQLCVDGMTDSAHCGATEDSCGVACAAGERCCGGTCVGDTDATCGSCDACSGTQQCCGAPGSGACVADLDTNNCLGCGNRCAPGEACCGGEGCTNLQNDEDNCGVCGRTCDSGQTCSNGVCCAGTQVGCGGSCVNLQNDEEHCGTCNRACTGLAGICCRGGCVGIACL